MHFLLLYDFTPDYLQRRLPYRGEHLLTHWTVRPWTTVVGALAAMPVRLLD